MSSMKRYLSAFLAIVMLLSLFTGALSEEAIEALTAEGEAALAAVAADAASDEDEVIAAGDEDQAVGEVGEMELPSDDGADDTAAAPAAGEDDGLEIIPEGPAEAPADDADGEPADDADGEPADDADGEPADDANGEPADDAAEEPTDDADGEPVDDAGEEPADDAAEEPADDAAEEPTDDAEDPDFMGLFASSNEGEEYFNGSETVFPEDIDITLERNGEILGNLPYSVDNDKLRFYADVFPRNAMYPGIFWNVWIDKFYPEGDMTNPVSYIDEYVDEYDDYYYELDEGIGIGANGVLTVKKLICPVDVVVEASTIRGSESNDNYKSGVRCFLTGDYELDEDTEGPAFGDDGYPIIRSWTDEYGVVHEPILYHIDEIYDDSDPKNPWGAIDWNGYDCEVEYDYDTERFFFVVPPIMSQQYQLTIFPHATGIKIFQKLENDREVEIKAKDQVIVMADEKPQFRVEVSPAAAMPGFRIFDVSKESVNELNIGRNRLGVDDAEFEPDFASDDSRQLTIYPCPDGDENVSGNTVYRVASSDGLVSTTLRMYRKPGSDKAVKSLGLAEGVTGVEVGLKQQIDLTNYILDDDTTIHRIPLFKVDPEDAEYDLTFKTSATKIIGLTEDGVVTGKKAGTAYVTVAVKGDPSIKPVTLKVVVKKKAVSKVSIGGLKVRYLRYFKAQGDTEAHGDTVKLAASVSPKGASTRVYWTSDDEDIATVDQNGNVTAVDYGTTYINAVSMDGSGRVTYVEIRCCDPVVDIKPHTVGSLPNLGWYEGYQDETNGALVIGVKTRARVYSSQSFADELDEELDYYRYHGVTFTTDKKGKKIINISRDSDGNTYITGKKAGTATVTAHSEDGFRTKPFKVTVVKPVKVAMGLKNASGEAVTKRTFNLEDIESLRGTLYPSVTPAANKVNSEILTFTSTNDDVAYVGKDETGTPCLNFGGQPGTATIKAYLRDFVSVGSISITVFEPINQLKFKDEDKYADPGDNQTLRVYEVAKGKKIKLPMPDFQPATSQVDLTWETSNKAVATVTNGVVTGKKAGTVTIRARSKVKADVVDELQVTVMPKPVSKVTVTPNGGVTFPTAPANKFFFNINDENANYEAVQMSALVAPGAGTASQKVRWSAVDEYGYEVPITDEGVLSPELEYDSRTITVTAAAMDGSGKKGTAVLVFDDYVTGIQLTGNSPDKNEIWLAKGKDFYLAGYDGETCRLQATWASGEENWYWQGDANWSVTTKAGKKIINISRDSGGDMYVTGKKAGTAKVRVADKQTGVSSEITVKVFDKPKAVSIQGADNGVLHLHGVDDTATLTATVTANKKQKIPGDVYWVTEYDAGIVEVDPNTGDVTALVDEGTAMVYAIPRWYDLGQYENWGVNWVDYTDPDTGDTYVDEDYFFKGHHLPAGAVVGKVEVRITPEVDEVRVFGSHSVAVNGAAKLVGRTYTDGGMAEDQRIAWTSTDENIATVDPNTGVVRGVSAGRVCILATAKGVNPDSTAPECRFFVDVTEPITKIWILVNGYDEGESTFIAYKSNMVRQLSVVCEPFNADPDIKWSSSNSKIVTVDANGVVRQSPKLKLKSMQDASAWVYATAIDKVTNKPTATAKIKIWVSNAGQ